MGTDVAKKQKTWADILEENKEAFALALPRVGLTAERFSRMAWTTMRQNPKLQKSDPKTLVSSLIQAAELGLSVSNTLGHAYLVPFANKKTNTIDCTLIVGYRGYLTLMKRTGEIIDAKATIVYENEPLEMEAGDKPYLRHKQLPPNKRGKAIVGAYCTVIFRDGVSTYEWMWHEDIMKIRNRSQAKNDGPWITDEEEMIKKTVIRRIAKRVGISAELVKAAVIDEYNEVGIRTGDMLMPDDEPQKSIEESVKPAERKKKVKTLPNKAHVDHYVAEVPVEEPPPEQKTDDYGPDFVPATEAQLKMIHTIFGKLKITSDEIKYRVIGQDILKIGGPLTTFKSISKEEASLVIKNLQEAEKKLAG